MKYKLNIKWKYTQILLISCLSVIIALTGCTNSIGNSTIIADENNVQNEYRGLKPKGMSETQIHERLVKHYNDLVQILC